MKPLILGSASPRRAFLLRECGFDPHIRPSHADESFDERLAPETIPGILALRKWTAGLGTLGEDECLLTADTVVILHNRILNKPADEAEAVSMLSDLSANTHTVVTGVCMGHRNMDPVRMEVRSLVTFHPLTSAQIRDYVETFKPLDKAGAYGAQECLAPDADPCSPEEKAFIERLGLGDIITRSRPAGWRSSPMTAIRTIDGPYFNVMGLPIAEIHDALNALLG